MESLRADIERKKRRLDEALIFHASEIRPRLERLAELQIRAVRALAPLLDDRRLSKVDVRGLTSILRQRLEETLPETGGPPADPRRSSSGSTV